MKEKYNYVFERYEKKYLLTEEKYHIFTKELEPYMQVDEYGLSTICNIYYDTPNFYLIRKSLEKPRYKEKFRVRSYGVPTDSSDVFLEIKKKLGGIVYKRRAHMSHRQSVDYLNFGIKPYESQILREIDYFFMYYTPSPAVFLAYDRVAMYGIQDPGLRMTFDSNIRSRFTELDLTLGDHGEYLLSGNEKYLLEIKVMNAMPVWLTGLLSKYQIFPTSFSKYGKVYEKKTAEEILKSKREMLTYV